MSKFIYALLFAMFAFALPAGAAVAEKAPPQPSKAIAAAPAAVTGRIVLAKANKAKKPAAKSGAKKTKAKKATKPKAKIEAKKT